MVELIKGRPDIHRLHWLSFGRKRHLESVDVRDGDSVVARHGIQLGARGNLVASLRSAVHGARVAGRAASNGCLASYEWELESELRDGDTGDLRSRRSWGRDGSRASSGVS